jgi:hypothetical protein
MTQPKTLNSSLSPDRIQRAATQFYWIAALSLFNLILLITNAPVVFPTGLAIAYLLAILSALLEIAGRIVVALGALGTVGLFALFGYYGKKGASWAFIAGIALYVLDGVIWGFLGDWISVGFHVLIIVLIIRDLVARPRSAP